MDTCPDCLRPLFQDLIHTCRRTAEARPAPEQGASRTALPVDEAGAKTAGKQ